MAGTIATMPFRVRAASVLPALATAALLSAACGGGGGAGPAPQGVAVADPGGVTLAIASGPLAGVVVEVPAGALSRPTDLAVRVAFASAQPGFAIVGPAAAVTPGALQLLRPARISMPYTSGRPVVLTRGGDGRVVELGPVTVDFVSQTVTAATLELGTFWAGARYFDGVRAFPYLPLRDGNRWEFEDDVTLTMTRSTTEPNLAGRSVLRLEFATPAGTFGFYLTGNGFGPVDAVGGYAALGVATWQQLHAPARLLPGEVTLGQPVRSQFTWSRYQPLGATEVVGVGTGEHELVATHGRDLATPAGGFEDLLEVDFVASFRDPAGRAAVQSIVLVLARDVGPVAVELFGVPVRLVRAEVNGRTYGA